MKTILAIDLGATSGRGILYSIEKGKLISKEVSRFKNSIHKVKGRLCWNIDNLEKNIKKCIKVSQQQSKLSSIGIDTWGVDFVFLDTNGEIITQPVSYRDSRTESILDEIARYSSLNDLYFKTGNQLMEINTLFQLIACKSQTPEEYFKANKLLMISDYLNYSLTGEVAIERSIASTMQMVNPLTKDWNQEVLKTFEISELLLPKLVSEGNILGKTSKEISKNEIVVVNVCQHDTASAVAAIPHEEENLLYISCGTWSLIGTELKSPILTDSALKYNFTNEAGYDGTTRFLKNCTGLWILEELKKSFFKLGNDFSYDEITEMVSNTRSCVPTFDTDASTFSSPGNMIEKIVDYFADEDITISPDPAILFKIVYQSLAEKYQEVILQLEKITGNVYKRIDLIGGGSKSNYFSQLVADVTGKTVVTGLYEATSIGNALVQLKALGCVKDMKEAKKLVKESITFNYFYPKEEEENDTIS